MKKDYILVKKEKEFKININDYELLSVIHDFYTYHDGFSDEVSFKLKEFYQFLDNKVYGLLDTEEFDIDNEEHYIKYYLTRKDVL